MRFCEKLAKLRKERNLSQEMLADKLNMSRQAISKWESGSTYPDMEKMLEICKVLDCKLDDLLDDGALGEKEPTKISKFSIDNMLKELLGFITKTYNMFCSMKFSEKIKCLLEMTFIILLLALLFNVIENIGSYILSNILSVFPVKLIYGFTALFSFIFYIISRALGFIITIHLFKIRYLDYFITVEDKEVEEKIIEEPIDEIKNHKTDKHGNVILEKKKEKIIIRDPKHSTFSFFGLISKIIVFFIKAALIFIGFFAILSFVIIAFCTFSSLLYIKYGLIFLGLFIAGLGCVLINYVALEFTYNFIVNKNLHLKRMFIIIIIGLLSIGMGFAISFIQYTSFDTINNFNDILKPAQIKINMKDNLHIDYILDDEIDIIIDDTIDYILIDYKKLDNASIEYYEHRSSNYNNAILYGRLVDNVNPIDDIKLILQDIKNKKARDYSYLTNFEITSITISTENYEILKGNR